MRDQRKPTFADVADLIGDRQLLEAALEKAATAVRDEVHNAAFDLKRSEAREDLERLKIKGRRFEAALNRAWEHVLGFPSNADDVWIAARKAIAEVDAVSVHVLARLDPKGGRPELPGRVTCALIVISAWAAIRGKRPSANNVKAQEACDDYWVACGQEREGDVSKWQRHIKAARAVPKPQGTELLQSFF